MTLFCNFENVRGFRSPLILTIFTLFDHVRNDPVLVRRAQHSALPPLRFAWQHTQECTRTRCRPKIRPVSPASAPRTLQP
uniref:Uncharacterized protein n=1 Tax=Panagrellus redivivus TaxID=6233 RepID=A0A7E4W7Y3_PANRE